MMNKSDTGRGEAGARIQDRVIERIPLDQIDESYLVRDRLVQDEEEMASLKTSLRARGQQIPVELIRLTGSDSGKPFGLITGWRRLTALRELYSQTGEPEFAEIQAFIVEHGTAQDAYLSMVEENEIRVNLSHYERARIALRAVHTGVFPDQRAALRALYSAAPRSRRSKIGSFIGLVDQFDGVLQHPAAISEKLGLALARETLRNPRLAQKLRERLRRAPARTAAEETRILMQAVAPTQDPPSTESSQKARTAKRQSNSNDAIVRDSVDGVALRYHARKGKIELTGEGLDQSFFEALKAWLADRGA